MNTLKVIETADGSHSLLNETLNETYHSTNGAVQESLHVFIKNGLHHWMEGNSVDPVSILEVGFGTGLNALLTLQTSIEQSQKIHFTTLEAFPIRDEIIRQLNYPSVVAIPGVEKLFLQLHAADWNRAVSITPNFTLEKIAGKVQEMNLMGAHFDIIFFDAFAPAKQREMWELPVLKKVIYALKPNGIFVTYCAQGQLKRDLRSLDVTVESLAGPPGKREMVRGKKLVVRH